MPAYRSLSTGLQYRTFRKLCSTAIHLLPLFQHKATSRLHPHRTLSYPDTTPRTQALVPPPFHLLTKGHSHHNPAILIPPLAPHHSSLILFLAKKPTPWFTDMVCPEYSTREPLSCRLSTPSLREPYHRNSDRGETNGPSGRPSHWYQALGLLLAPCVLRKRCRP